MILSLRVLFLSLLGLGGVQAAPSLYSTGPDEPTAYVRFVNTAEHSAQLGKESVVLAGQSATAFQPVRAGHPLDGVIMMGAQRLTLQDQPAEGQFLTIVLPAKQAADSQVSRFLDPVDDFNAAKASVTLYNAATTCSQASLSVQGRDLRLVQGVAPGKLARRQINPAQLALAVACEDGRAPIDLPASGLLQAGERYSVIVYESAQSAVQALWLQDAMQD